jgi:putative component of membrane protein insertase Oxa1/YidC/SpoIIIJ protein YidD
MSWLAIKLIEFYQIFLSFDTGILRFLAPGGACRYPIRCSEYTKIQIKEYGVFKGGWLGLRRIISCR